MSGSPLDGVLAAYLVRDLTASSPHPATVIAPFTGARLHDLPNSTADDVVRAADRARSAQKTWQDAGFAHRRRVLLRAHDLLLARRESLLDAIQTETGKTRGQAFEEVFNAANATRYAALSARRLLRDRRRRSGIPLVMRTTVQHVPLGLVTVITPWNYPLALAVMDIAPALAAGNAILHKADDQGALTILLARRAFIDAGVPPDLWAVVAGDAAEIGDPLVDLADYVCFTGSSANGRRIAERAARRLIGVSLELGGKNPLIVLDDVDPVRAAGDAAYACFSSAGQLCVSTERIYVLRDVAAAFTAALVERTRTLRIGAAFDYSTDVGSLATRAQFDRVRAHLNDALAKGATLLAGGSTRPDLGPYFLEPAVLTNVTEEMSCSRDETFGAVVAVHVVDSVAEAVTLADDSEFGLNASVLGRSRSRARRVAAALRTGSVNINEGYRATFSAVDAPMGGMKHSGLGRRSGREGILRFVEARTIAEATGLIQLPRTGAEFRRLGGPLLLVLRIVKTLRRR
jgi:succinate-semialdehyde dehydrogenase/glutarate-semialdehyde dehydrogenase